MKRIAMILSASALLGGLAGAEDIAVATVGREKYAAVVQEGSGTTHFVYLLYTRNGHWRYSAMRGGSVTGIPGIKDIALHAHFPLAAAKQLAVQLETDAPLVSTGFQWPKKKAHPLWASLQQLMEKHRMHDLKPSEYVLSEDVPMVARDYLITSANGVDYAIVATDVQNDERGLQGFWYQLFERRRGVWRCLNKSGPYASEKRSPGWFRSWVKRYGVPPAAGESLSLFGKPDVTLQALPGEF